MSRLLKVALKLAVYTTTAVVGFVLATLAFHDTRSAGKIVKSEDNHIVPQAYADGPGDSSDSDGDDDDDDDDDDDGGDG